MGRGRLVWTTFKSFKEKMSWNAYIDNLIAQSKDASGRNNIDKACIIDIDGSRPWTENTYPNAYKVIIII